LSNTNLALDAIKAQYYATVHSPGYRRCASLEEGYGLIAKNLSIFLEEIKYMNSGDARLVMATAEIGAVALRVLAEVLLEEHSK
jgi:hypothetical protein